ncbi:unnamed protein product [Bursaphelenchus xylophilus]|uniref:(pine wood nematode) hypothetical protein n=1 Tax=Bursaphelenchus xylophilus TaxID=6326 RepID=A0A1I7SCR5_BURXY|nr:unnamed protein product [Bursaphelenchus xylophilus]CAG9093652.1 unnamed protein product [Bursaphelenchus xylophilus]
MQRDQPTVCLQGDFQCNFKKPYLRAKAKPAKPSNYKSILEVFNYPITPKNRLVQLRTTALGTSRNFHYTTQRPAVKNTGKRLCTALCGGNGVKGRGLLAEGEPLEMGGCWGELNREQRGAPLLSHSPLRFPLATVVSVGRRKRGKAEEESTELTPRARSLACSQQRALFPLPSVFVRRQRVGK